MKSLLVFALIAMSVSYSQAQEGASSMTFGKEEAQVAPRGFLPFIGMGGGYTGYENNALAEGTPSSIKLLGSWYLESPLVFDLGYGYNNQQFSNDAAPETARTEGAMEIAMRWNSTNRWQTGVVYNQFFNQGDAYGAYTADAQFAGLQLLKEFNMSASWLGRLGARAQSLTNNTDGLIMMYMIDLQIGWNPRAYKTSVSSQAAESQESLVEEAMAPEPTAPVAAAPVNELNYSAIAATGGAITFGSSKAAVAGKDKQRLDKIAKVLSENPDLVERVEVRGYADATGSERTNERISQQRAVNVRNELQKSGLNDVDVVAVGKGASDHTGVKSQDRRAELVFIGVKDETALRKALSDIE
jgi:outer membrane protein OmpA-like peptidoglycan-associated protein